ncbi:uncharacterized protein GLRG_09439 [Colletotrichum graminicola M1.001]|uniref:Uncharacterized protein n=1 Tax=Colletotrichum graminicola (strain M1.001 / M2 / FGSC 10212) TaxID=645133 RepID=E3QTM0_COLGM|nr:uncharacterized protein GLRG_09439 [Colletotrichum graminicola M1.001]EFQ34295.1 hypothetical protein GLRG_09439 [Colletotrichum graminicola M1.001]
MSFAALNLKLYYAGMNFVLLERRTNIIEDFGASLVLSPPSLRILYHFGIFDKVAEMSAELFDNKKGLHNGRTCVQVYQVVVRRLTSTVRFPSSSHPGGLAWLPGIHGSSIRKFHRAHLIQTTYKNDRQGALSYGKEDCVHWVYRYRGGGHL